MTNAYGEADMTAQKGFQEALYILALIGVVCASREQQAGKWEGANPTEKSDVA